MSSHSDPTYVAADFHLQDYDVPKTLEDWAEALSLGLVDVTAIVNTRSGALPFVKVSHYSVKAQQELILSQAR